MTAPGLPVSRASSARSRRLKADLCGWSFIFPSFLHLAIFTLFPIGFAFYLSLHKWDVLKKARPFIGLQNYQNLLHDALFWNALFNSAYYAIVSVPLGMLAALIIALLVNQKLPLVNLFRTVYYLPAVSSAVAVSMVWTFIYLPESGLLDWVLGACGLRQASQIDWLNSPGLAMPALIIMSVWLGLGPRMVLYLAGLGGIPASLYEAAEVDGGGRWACFRHITWPLLLPTSFFILVTSSISAFQIFTPVYMMTQGGPMRRTDVVGYHIYNEAWRQFHMGMASAQSYVLFLVILLVTVVQFRIVQRRMAGYSLA